MEQGNKPFRIKRIDIIRDGGTLFIETNTDKKYYADKITMQIHKDYPTNSTNLLIDDTERGHLKIRIKQHKEELNRQIKICDLIKWA